MNLVELIADEQRSAPCRFGNIVEGHACYCHHPHGPRKCPIWRALGEHAEGWHDDEQRGGCRFFVRLLRPDEQRTVGSENPKERSDGSI